MTQPLFWLAATLVLTLVYIIAPAAIRTAKFGLKWNASPRDADVGDPGILAGRLARAQANLFETLPVMIGAVLIAHVAGADPVQTANGAQLYFWSRLAYLPVYAAGIPYVRGVVWVLGLVGLVTVLSAIFATPMA